MSHLPAHSEMLWASNPHSVVHVIRTGLHTPPQDLISDSLFSAHVSNDARNGADEPPQLQATRPCTLDSSFNANGNSRTKRDIRWVSHMDEYLAASRLCREEAMAACSSLAAGVHWPSAERESRKKDQNKPLSSTCRALNVGTKRSWRGLKKLFSKQFMPFSNRDHHGLHHINTTINKRSLKTLNVGGKKMDAIDVETCRSQLGSWEKKCKLQQGKLKEKALKNKVHILLSKASDVAWEVCDILNLE